MVSKIGQRRWTTDAKPMPELLFSDSQPTGCPGAGYLAKQRSAKASGKTGLEKRHRYCLSLNDPSHKPWPSTFLPDAPFFPSPEP